MPHPYNHHEPEQQKVKGKSTGDAKYSRNRAGKVRKGSIVNKAGSGKLRRCAENALLPSTGVAALQRQWVKKLPSVGDRIWFWIKHAARPLPSTHLVSQN